MQPSSGLGDREQTPVNQQPSFCWVRVVPAFPAPTLQGLPELLCTGHSASSCCLGLCWYFGLIWLGGATPSCALWVRGSLLAVLRGSGLEPGELHTSQAPEPALSPASLLCSCFVLKGCLLETSPSHAIALSCWHCRCVPGRASVPAWVPWPLPPSLLLLSSHAFWKCACLPGPSAR